MGLGFSRNLIVKSASVALAVGTLAPHIAGQGKVLRRTGR